MAILASPSAVCVMVSVAHAVARRDGAISLNRCTDIRPPSQPPMKRWGSGKSAKQIFLVPRVLTRSRGEEEQEGKGTVPSMPSGAFVKEEDMPSAARYRQGEGRGPTHAPPDAFV